MTKSVGVHEAKTHLSRLLVEVAAGNEVVITSRGRAMARLVPPQQQQRTFGLDEGRIRMAGNFDTLTDDELETFGA